MPKRQLKQVSGNISSAGQDTRLGQTGSTMGLQGMGGVNNEGMGVVNNKGMGVVNNEGMGGVNNGPEGEGQQWA